jgi:flagellar biosynthesis protein FlhB
MFNIFNKKIDSLKLVFVGLFIIFSTLAVFGPILISQHMDGNCLSTLFNSESCPGQLLMALEHHLSLPHQFASVSFAGIAVLVMCVITAISSMFIPVQPIVSFERQRERIPKYNYFRGWLSLLENSPNA